MSVCSSGTRIPIRAVFIALVSQLSSRPAPFSVERWVWPQVGRLQTSKLVLWAVVLFWDRARSQTGIVCLSSSLRLCPTSMPPLRP